MASAAAVSSLSLRALCPPLSASPSLSSVCSETSLSSIQATIATVVAARRTDADGRGGWNIVHSLARQLQVLLHNYELSSCDHDSMHGGIALISLWHEFSRLAEVARAADRKFLVSRIFTVPNDDRR